MPQLFLVEWMIVLLTEQRAVTHHSVRLVRVMALDVEHIICGTFSSPSEGVSSPTPVFIDSVVHASCDARHSTPVTFQRLLEVTCTGL